MIHEIVAWQRKHSQMSTTTRYTSARRKPVLTLPSPPLFALANHGATFIRPTALHCRSLTAYDSPVPSSAYTGPTVWSITTGMLPISVYSSVNVVWGESPMSSKCGWAVSRDGLSMDSAT